MVFEFVLRSRWKTSSPWFQVNLSNDKFVENQSDYSLFTISNWRIILGKATNRRPISASTFHIGELFYFKPWVPVLPDTLNLAYVYVHLFAKLQCRLACQKAVIRLPLMTAFMITEYVKNIQHINPSLARSQTCSINMLHKFQHEHCHERLLFAVLFSALCTFMRTTKISQKYKFRQFALAYAAY